MIYEGWAGVGGGAVIIAVASSSKSSSFGKLEKARCVMHADVLESFFAIDLVGLLRTSYCLGESVRLGDLLTVVQENLPIKIVIFDNGRLGFIDFEQKSAGLEPVFTDLKNPDFGKVAEAMGLWERCVSKAGELDEAVGAWLAQPVPALLDVKVNPMQLVMPPSPFVSPEAVSGMGVYSAKAMLHGKGHDVWEMIVEIIP